MGVTMVKSMKHTSLSYISVIAIIGLSFVLSGHVAQPTLANFSANSNPPLHASTKLMQATADGKRTDVIVYANGYADLSLASQFEKKSDKTQFVFKTLTQYANLAQASLRRDLSLRSVDYDVLWLANAVLVRKADRELVIWLNQRQDVARMAQDAPTLGQLGFAANDAVPDPIQEGRVEVPNGVEPGVQQVNAPAVWEMGYRGQGIVLASLDTGVQWDHAALKAKYRGWDGIRVTHRYNWFDAIAGKSEAFDDYGHGSHTTGTIMGDDGAGNQVGVAPDAKWIACRNMDHGAGTVARYISCFQFALAPTDPQGNNPNPSQAADITNNSWGCSDSAPYEEGCEMADALLNIAQAMRAAGMMTVASAGNDGRSLDDKVVCKSVHHAPATLNQAFTVGAVTHGNQIARFSARGPSIFTGQLKPNVVAPGENVRSAALGNGTTYSNMSGTSMAGPHVAGVVALLWSAVPWLQGQIDETEAILSYTATPLNNSDTTCNEIPTSLTPNNTFGFGLINAKAAVDRAQKTDLGITKSETGNNLITITHTISNQHYTLAMTNLTLSATLPVGAEIVSINNSGVKSGNVIQWNTPAITPGAAYQVSLVIRNTNANLPLFTRQFNRIPAQRIMLQMLKR